MGWNPFFLKFLVIPLMWGLFNGCRIDFGCFLASGFGFFLGFLSRYHLPCICNSLELEAVILHSICYILAFTLHSAWYLLHLAMFAFHFAGHLSHFGISTSHLHDICYILVLQTFMWVSWGFFRLSLRVSFKLRFHLGFHLGFYLGLHSGVHLGFHLGFL